MKKTKKRFTVVWLGMLSIMTIPVVYRFIDVEGTITLAVITGITTLVSLYMASQGYTDGEMHKSTRRIN